MRKILIIIFISNLFAITSFAQCNFGINLGDNYPKAFEKKYGKISLLESIVVYREKADEICGSNIFEDFQVEYAFIYGELGSIKIVALNDLNDKKNVPSDKLILMNYVKSTYGDFDTGTNPKGYNNYKVWKKNNSVILYKRLMGARNIWEESLYISNKKYRKLIIGARAFKENMKLIVK